MRDSLHEQSFTGNAPFDFQFGIHLGAKLQMRRIVNYCQWKEVHLIASD